MYGYAVGSPQVYVDPEGRFIQIVLGAAAGFAWDQLITKLREKCECATADSTLGPAGNVALGAAAGATGPFATKGRTGVAGGGASGQRTSVLSKAINAAYKNGQLSPGTTNRIRVLITRPASKLVPGGALVIMAKDLMDLLNCGRGE